MHVHPPQRDMAYRVPRRPGVSPNACILPSAGTDACLSTGAVGDMLDGAPGGQREAARRALQAKGVQLVPDALVTSVQRAGPPTDPGAHASDPGAHGGDGDVGRRQVHLKVGGSGPEARAHCGTPLHGACLSPHEGQACDAKRVRVKAGQYLRTSRSPSPYIPSL